MATYCAIHQQLVDLCEKENISVSIIDILKESKIDCGFFLDKTDIEEEKFTLIFNGFNIVGDWGNICVDIEHDDNYYEIGDLEDVNELYMLEKMYELVCNNLPDITFCDWCDFIKILLTRKNDWLCHKVNSAKSDKWLVVHNDMTHHILNDVSTEIYSAIAKHNGEKYAYVFKFCAQHRNTNNIWHQFHYNNIYYAMTGHDPYYRYEIVLTNEHLSCEYEYFPEDWNGEEYDNPCVIHYYYNETDKKICHHTKQYTNDEYVLGEMYVIEL